MVGFVFEGKCLLAIQAGFDYHLDGFGIPRGSSGIKEVSVKLY
jgi:hypothetical protein